MARQKELKEINTNPETREELQNPLTTSSKGTAQALEPLCLPSLTMTLLLIYVPTTLIR